MLVGSDRSVRGAVPPGRWRGRRGRSRPLTRDEILCSWPSQECRLVYRWRDTRGLGSSVAVRQLGTSTFPLRSHSSNIWEESLFSGCTTGECETLAIDPIILENAEFFDRYLGRVIDIGHTIVGLLKFQIYDLGQIDGGREGLEGILVIC